MRSLRDSTSLFPAAPTSKDEPASRATARSKGSGGSLFEPRTDTQVGTPATNITLFQDGDEHGYNLGQRVGGNVLAQTMGYINGTISG